MKKGIKGIITLLALAALAASYFAFFAENPWFVLKNQDDDYGLNPLQAAIIRPLVQKDILPLTPNGDFPAQSYLPMESLASVLCALSDNTGVKPSFQQGTFTTTPVMTNQDYQIPVVTFNGAISAVRAYARNPSAIQLPIGTNEWTPLTMFDLAGLILQLDQFQ